MRMPRLVLYMKKFMGIEPMNFLVISLSEIPLKIEPWQFS